MLNKDKSVRLTHFIVRACYVFLGAMAIALPILLKNGFYKFDILGQISTYVLGPFYAVVPAGYIALFCLDRLLVNVRKEIVFDAENVRFLRIISRACFYAGCVGIVSFLIILLNNFLFETLFILAVGELFMGLVVKVVKNIFEAAIKIKSENDLTI